MKKPTRSSSLLTVAFCAVLSVLPLSALAEPKSVTQMNETLQFTANSPTRDFEQTGSAQFSMALSGLGSFEKFQNTGKENYSLSNAQLIVQGRANLLQYYIQAGKYLMPGLGEGISSSAAYSPYGEIPHAYLSYELNTHWSLMVGKLLSMPGYENPFTYQNQNIQRGLLERHNNTISRGVQFNYRDGSNSFFTTLNDGFYSGDYKWGGVGGSFAQDSNNTTTLMWGGPLQGVPVQTFVTPVLQNNAQIFNVIHSLSLGQWSFTPYFQYTYIPAHAVSALPSPISTNGVASIINYKVPADINFLGLSGQVHIPLRLERLYISTNALLTDIESQTFSNANSVTITPTLQAGIYYLRAEASHLSSANPLFMRGASQNRFLIEFGILY